MGTRPQSVDSLGINSFQSGSNKAECIAKLNRNSAESGMRGHANSPLSLLCIALHLRAPTRELPEIQRIMH